MEDKKYRILIIRTHRIGDILQVTPMIRGLREKYPKAKISILVAEGFQEVVKNNPDIDEVIRFPRLRYSDTVEGAERFPWGVYREIRDLVRELKERRYDLVINRQFTDAEAVLTYLIDSVDVRGKVMNEDGRFVYADPVTARVVDETLQQGRNPGLQNLVDLSIEVGGAEPSERGLVFPVKKEVKRSCRKRLQNQGFSRQNRFFGIQVGASRAFKKLGSLAMAAVVDDLVQRQGYKVLFFGSRGEIPLGDEILKRVQSDPKAIFNLMGETTLEELGGFLMACDFILTGDTGTMHVAAAVGTRTISTSYGMTYPYETAPYGPGHLVLYSELTCSPCDDPDLCPHGLACERVLLPEVLIPGIEVAQALARGNGEEVRERVVDPRLQGVRLFYTGDGPLSGKLQLYDLSKGIPSLQGRTDQAAVDDEERAPGTEERLTLLLATVGQIREQIDGGLQEFAKGRKVEGFQAVLPIFDLWDGTIRSAAEIFVKLAPSDQEGFQELTKLHERLLPVLIKLSQTMEKMDLASFQDILSAEMRPLVLEEERVLKAWRAGKK